MNEWWVLDGGYTWRLVAQVVDDGRVGFNRACIDLEPWQIVSYTLSVACFFIWLRKLLKADRPVLTRIRAVVHFPLYSISLLFQIKSYPDILIFPSNESILI